MLVLLRDKQFGASRSPEGSKGGFTTKIHAITDTLGNPLDFILTGSQASDIAQAENLLALTPEGAAALVGDKKGYDSDAFFKRSLKKALNLLFRLAAIDSMQEIAIGSFIKSVI